MLTDDGTLYTVLKKDGRDVCGLYGMGEEEMKRVNGGRAVWRGYFTVDNADDTLSRARSLGGAVIHEPITIGTDGCLAVVQDPTGASFAVWEPRNHIGAQVFGEPGALAWAELYTRDTQAAASFYGGLFGWHASTTRSADGGSYTEYQLNGAAAAGMIAIREEWGPMPAHWSVYFEVTDLDASRAKAGELGASELMPSMQVEGVGRFVFLQDPQGGVVAIIQRAREAG
jgi:predicted enzyme related to lactoylglutathione lyase